MATTEQLPATTDKKTLTIRDHLQSEAFKAQLASVVPAHCKPERIARVAATALTRTPMLAECEQASFFQALLSLSEWGLEPNGRDAHLIPFRNNKRGVVECQLIIDYKGYVKLCYQNPRVRSIHTECVYEGDDFGYNLGQITKHVPWAFRNDEYKPAERGECVGAYARVQLDGADPKFEMMTADDIEVIRKRSRAANAGPWVTDWEQMARKTVFRRCVKWLPISAELTDAMERDDDRFEPLSTVTTVRPRGVAGLEQQLSERFALTNDTADETHAGYTHGDNWDLVLADQLEACTTKNDVNLVEVEWSEKGHDLQRVSEMCTARRKELK